MKRPAVIASIVVIIVIIAIVFAVRQRTADASQKTQYVLAAVQSGPVRKTISATGTLQPWTTVDIKSKAGGRINALLVDVGSQVTKGQILARIDPSDTLLAVNTAQAGINGAIAHRNQSVQTYALQIQQSRIAVQNAQAALQAAHAARASAAARVGQAQAQAGAQPKQTRAAIAQAEANYQQAIRQRRSLDATHPQDRASAQAAYDQAAANQKNAQTTLYRQVALVKKGYVAQQVVDAAQATYDVNVAQTQTAQAKLSTLAAQQQAENEAADAHVAQARAALQQAQAGTVDIATARSAAAQAQAALSQSDAQAAEAAAALAQAQANIATNGIKKEDIIANQASIAANQASLTNATTTLQQTIVRAPTSGIVLQKYVEQGTIITSGISSVATGTSIVQLGDITRMYVNVTVDETDVANVDAGQDVDVNFDAYPGMPFTGKVTRIDPLAVVTQNVTSFNVRVEIDNSAPTFRLLRPGMNATCQFIVDQKDNVLNVPAEAVQTDDSGGSFVQVASGGHAPPADPTSTAPAGALIDVKTTNRPVELGLEGDDADEVKSGLKEGDKIVTQTITPAPPTPAGTSSPFAGGGGRGGGGRGGGGGGR